MTTYQETLSPLAQMVHGRLAAWLETDVAFLGEDETTFEFAARHTNGYLVGISYNRLTETYTLYRLDVDLQPRYTVTVRIDAFMVMELFTKRRLIAALEVFN